MKLTAKGRYAVQAMADIAANANGRTVSASDVALRQGISANYLDQLLLKLRRAGLISSVRGVAGGYGLSRSADEISVAEIVSAVDEEIRTTACGGGEAGCRGSVTRCMTHDLWDELGRRISDFLENVSLADIVNKRVGAAAGSRGALREVLRPESELLR